MNVNQFKGWVEGYLAGVGGTKNASIEIILEKIKELHTVPENPFKIGVTTSTEIPNMCPSVFPAVRMDSPDTHLRPPYEITC